MILTPEERIRSFVADGLWSRVTLDNVFRKGLAATPEAVVFRDLAGPPVPGLGASLSFAEVDRRVEALAAFFAGIGLKPDAVLGLHLPACSDAAVILMAALRAGLIVCPLPLHWTKAEIEAAIAAASIKGLVTASQIENEPVGDMVRDVAADTFAIRFVFAVGHGLPDGLIDLAAVLADMDSFGAAPEVFRRGSPADHVALLSLARSGDDRLVVVPHSHNHLVAAALAHVLEAGIDRGEVVLSTLHPASLGGVAGALMTALLAGGTVTFHHVLTIGGLADAVAGADVDRVVLPAVCGADLATMLPSHVALSLSRTGLEPRDLPAITSGHRVTDLVTLGGVCLLPVSRTTDGRVADLPAGPIRLPYGGGSGPVLFETRIKPRVRAGERRPSLTIGELLVSGPAVPDAPWPEPASGGSGAVLGILGDGALRTGINAEAIAGNERLRLIGPQADLLLVAGRTISPARLDAMLKRHPAIADAAVFAVEADLVGSRLGAAIVPHPGQNCDLTDLSIWLDEQGCGALERPSTLIAVGEIPRGQDGTVLRRTLFLSAVA